MEPVNGKVYPFWGQFVDNKKDWIGGTMKDVDADMGEAEETTICDIEITPNGPDSAFVNWIGKDYACGGDVQFLGVDGTGPEGWLKICRLYGRDYHLIKKPAKSYSQVVEEAISEANQKAKG